MICPKLFPNLGFILENLPYNFQNSIPHSVFSLQNQRPLPSPGSFKHSAPVSNTRPFPFLTSILIHGTATNPKLLFTCSRNGPEGASSMYGAGRLVKWVKVFWPPHEHCGTCAHPPHRVIISQNIHVLAIALLH